MTALRILGEKMSGDRSTSHSSPQTVSSRMRPTSRVAHRDVGPRRLLEVFVIFELLCQLALLWSVLGQFRFFFRLATFASNLALMVISLKRDCRYHPAAKAAQWIMAIMLPGASQSPKQRQGGRHSADPDCIWPILGPLFWVPRVVIDLKPFATSCSFYGFSIP